MPIPRDDVSGITSQQLVVFSPDAQEYALPNTAVHESICFSDDKLPSAA